MIIKNDIDISGLGSAPNCETSAENWLTRDKTMFNRLKTSRSENGRRSRSAVYRKRAGS